MELRLGMLQHDPEIFLILFSDLTDAGAWKQPIENTIEIVAPTKLSLRFENLDQFIPVKWMKEDVTLDTACKYL